MSTSHLDTDPMTTLIADLEALRTCECALCDHTQASAHDDAAQWRLVWEFADDSGDTLGEDTMLLCEHCCAEWLESPESFGGQPLRAVRV